MLDPNDPTDRPEVETVEVGVVEEVDEAVVIVVETGVDEAEDLVLEVEVDLAAPAGEVLLNWTGTIIERSLLWEHDPTWVLPGLSTECYCLFMPLWQHQTENDPPIQ